MKPLVLGSLVRLRLGYMRYACIVFSKDLTSPNDYFQLRYRGACTDVDPGTLITVLEEKTFPNQRTSNGAAAYVKVALNTGQVGWISRRNLAIV
jgi:hypothetical protein